MRLFLSTLLVLAAALAGDPRSSAAETLDDCRAMAADADRLACYDALEATEAGDPLTLLPRLLGDPEAIDDYPLTGNSAALRALLPGQWQVVSWHAVAGLPADKILGLCDRRAIVIAPSERDAYALAASQVDRKSGESLPLWDITWLLGSRFAHARNMEGTLAFYGLDPAKQGLAVTSQMFRQAITTWTYLRLSDDALLLVGEEGMPVQLMLRCPDAE